MPEEARQSLENSTCSQSALNDAKLKSINERGGNEKYIDCPMCRNKGYAAVIENGSLIMRECECMAQRRTLKRIIASGLKDLVESNTFDNYETPQKWHGIAKQTAMDFVINGAGKWFTISGAPGAGKTHLCVAIASELMKANKEVRYLLWREEAPRLKSLVNEREEYERRMEAIKRVDVLYIDDFLKGNVTAADINLAFEILNARYNSKRTITIISTERTIEDIIGIDEAIGSRIYERSKGYYIKTPAENWRLTH